MFVYRLKEEIGFVDDLPHGAEPWSLSSHFTTKQALLYHPLGFASLIVSSSLIIRGEHSLTGFRILKIERQTPGTRNHSHSHRDANERAELSTSHTWFLLAFVQSLSRDHISPLDLGNTVTRTNIIIEAVLSS